MENITIREAALSDIKETARIITMTWKEIYNGIVPNKKLAELSSNNFITYLEGDIKSDDKTVLIAENEFQAIIGMISGGSIKQEAEGYDAELYAMYVMPDMQGKGIGQSLFNKLIEWLKTKEFKKVVAWVLEDNAKARDFYGRSNGSVIANGEIEIGGRTLKTVCYGWDLSGMALQTEIVSKDINEATEPVSEPVSSDFGSSDNATTAKKEEAINFDKNQEVGVDDREEKLEEKNEEII